MNSNIIQTLEQNGVKPTPMRMLVLEAMLVQARSLSLTEIENLLYPADRITIYRTLQTFVKNGIAHAIDTSGNGSVYALCPGNCTHKAHTDYHPHFVCEKCKQITCCTDFIFSLQQKPNTARYVINKMEMTIKGICSDCAKHEV
jgi:Fur family ferric uptake transcriptional regulator